MITPLRNLLIRELKKYLEKLEADSIECSEEECMNIIRVLAHEPISKETALIHTGFSRSKFDDYCSRGLLPKGRKRQGWKELVWYRDEINDSLILIRANHLS